MTLDVIAGHTSAGKTLGEVHPQLPGGERLLIGREEALTADVDLIFLALPHGASAEPAGKSQRADPSHESSFEKAYKKNNFHF